MTEHKWRLYAKPKGHNRFKPVDWNRGVLVTNLIYASMFTDDERRQLLEVDLAHPDNADFTFEFRRI